MTQLPNSDAAPPTPNSTRSPVVRAAHPYELFLHEVKKPGQYLGGETGEIQKDWSKATGGRMCLAFPDLYEVGMSHLGFKILYSGLNAKSDLIAERAYAPALDLEEQLRAHDVRLVSMENQKPLRAFDVVGFSLQFELTYSNVLLMLDLGGVPLAAENRTEEDPLVLAGGPVATHAEPISRFIDAFLIGDGEIQTEVILRQWTQDKQSGVPRAERLRRLSAIPGVYVPSLYSVAEDPDIGLQVVQKPTDPSIPFPVERTFLENFKEHPFPADGPVAATETVFDRVSVEIARGCTEGCRFCQAGMIYRPVRERSPESIINTIETAVDQGGYDEASLTSLSTADYSSVSPLVRETISRLEKKRVSLSVSSLRAYGLGEDVMDEMRKTRVTGMTFAPEAGTQRMRDVVNKNVTEEQLMVTAERVFSRGWQKMKLYFMIGLPTEQEEDVRGIVQTGVRALEVGQRIQGKNSPRVTVSVSTHVPKPHTPFQWCAMDALEEVVKKQRMLKDEVFHAGREGKKVNLRMHASEGSWLEGVLARGDRRLGKVIEHAYKHGARFDSWEEHLKLDVWRNAFESEGIELDGYLTTLPITARLPWDHIDVGLEEGFLAKEYRKAVRNRLSPPCGKAAGTFIHHTNTREAEQDERRLVCYDCGIACDMSTMREERLVFLRSMRASEPPEKQALPPIDRRRRGHRTPRPTADQGEHKKIRLAYTRLGRNAYQGHLDMVRMFPRVFRRAGLPLFYSEGFHPKPVMVFGPSLRLGTHSLAEVLDLKLRVEGLDLTDLLRRLNEASVSGLNFTDFSEIENGEKSVMKLIDEIEYVVGIPRDVRVAAGLPTAAAIEERWQAMRDTPIEVVRNIKGIKKKIAVNTFLSSFHPGEGQQALDRAGIVGDLLPIRMKIGMLPAGTARVSEVLLGVLGIESTWTPTIRTALRSSETGKSPMEALAKGAKPPARGASPLSGAKPDQLPTATGKPPASPTPDA